MFNISDVITILIFLISIFIGYKKGFIKTGFGLLSFFIAIILTFIFYKPVANLIKEKTGFENWICEYVYNFDVSKNDEDTDIDEQENEESYLDSLPDNLSNIIGLDEIKENAKRTMSEKISEFVVKLLAIIIVYIVVKLGLLILVWILDLLAKLPVVKQCNEILGIILGAILGLTRIYLVCAVVTLISSLRIANVITTLINTSLITHVFYNNNLLIKLLF